MRRYVSLVLLALFATLVFAPAAMAQMNDDQMMDDEMMSTSTAMMDDKLPGTGGPSLAPALAPALALMLLGSGVAAFTFVRRATS
jgi:hypothetical protein